MGPRLALCLQCYKEPWGRGSCLPCLIIGATLPVFLPRDRPAWWEHSARLAVLSSTPLAALCLPASYLPVTPRQTHEGHLRGSKPTSTSEAILRRV